MMFAKTSSEKGWIPRLGIQPFSLLVFDMLKSKVADILKESKSFSLIHDSQTLVLKIG